MSMRAWLRTPGARIVASAVAATGVAVIAVIALSPSQPGPAPAAVDAGKYLAAERLDRAVGYRGDLRLIALLGLGVEFGALAVLALRPPERLRRLLAGWERRPLLGAAAAGAGVSVVLALLALPLGIWAHELAVDVGISVQSIGGWLYDRVRSIAIAAVYAAAGAALLVLLQRRLRRTWWLAGALVIVVFAFVTSFLAPVVLAPIFNDFERLSPGPQRADVLELADRAGVDVGGVYVVDASSRGTSLNAYVSGLGSTRRVVLYDNLLDSAQRPALRSVVAHELGHVKQRDVPRGILFVAIVAPLGMLFVREAGGAIAVRAGSGPGRVSAIPAYALALTVAAFVLGIAGNQLSRQVEERADRFALELTGDPRGLIELQTELASRNLGDPDPPGWWQFAFGTHPTTAQRLGLAVAYRRAGTTAER